MFSSDDTLPQPLDELPHVAVAPDQPLQEFLVAEPVAFLHPDAPDLLQQLDDADGLLRREAGRDLELVDGRDEVRVGRVRGRRRAVVGRRETRRGGGIGGTRQEVGDGGGLCRRQG